MAASPISVIVAVIVLLQVAKAKGNVDIDALSSLKNNLVDPQHVFDSWNTNLTDPCTWFHLECNDDRRVTLLRLDAHYLAGTIPVDIGNLKNLKVLNLANNGLTGTIPASLANLKNAESIFLQNNRLTGPIPAGLGDLPKLVTLNVSNNDLCGPIPHSFSRIPHFLASNNPKLGKRC